MHRGIRLIPALSAGLFAGLLLPAQVFGQGGLPKVEDLLKYKPSQADVDYDTPKAEDLARCNVAVEEGGFILTGPAGEVLRRFSDTNGDKRPDQYRFYHLGLEVYRDIDTNGDWATKKNVRPDQCRWMNWGGTRWGLDQNEDGRIESWKLLSAQEAAAIAVKAIIQEDVQALSTVMLTDADIQTLRLPAGIAKQLQDSVAELPRKMQAALANSKVLNKQTTWVRFDPPLPGLILAETLNTPADLTVYENAMAYVQNGEKLELISIGEMVQVGNVWKLVSVPAPLDASGQTVMQVGGILMQPALKDSDDGSRTPAGEMSAEMQDLLAQLEKVDKASPTPDASPKAFADYNVARANISEKLIGISRNDDERRQWIQQFTDSLSTATQSGLYPGGLPRLVQLQEGVKSNQELLGYVFYRRLMAEYAVRLKDDDKATDEAASRTAREATQKWWFEQLEAFARQWPNSEDAPDAVVQLAISYELMGRIDDAKAWYSQLATKYPQTEGGRKAQGALRRLTLTGNKLTLAGRTLQEQPLNFTQYQGKVVLVIFWASYAQPFTDDLTAIKAAYAKYQPQGFEIVGINLDPDTTGLPAYLKQQGITWQNLRDAPREVGMQPGDYGFGIVSVPTMFLVNKQGIVEGGITAANLDFAVDALIQGRKLDARPPEDPATEDSTAPRGSSTAEKTKSRN
jgi:peroxiredoxin